MLQKNAGPGESSIIKPNKEKQTTTKMKRTYKKSTYKTKAIKEHRWETFKYQNNKQTKQKDAKKPLKEFFFQACIPVSSAPPAPTALLRKVNYSLILQSFYSYFS